jgi:trimeric autotransporter adhesin
MLNRKKKVLIAGGFAALLLIGGAVGCTGFFVNPTITSITVGPTATINQGATVQESAVGTFNDGSTKTLSSGVEWSSSSANVASINTGGLVTGNSPGSATITAAYQASTGTSSITVSLGNVTKLTISPTTSTATLNGGTANFTALATVQGDSTPQDVSATATWSLSNSTDFEITQGQDPAVVTVESTATAGEQVTVTATYQSTTTLTANATLTVTQ